MERGREVDRWGGVWYNSIDINSGSSKAYFR